MFHTPWWLIVVLDFCSMLLNSLMWEPTYSGTCFLYSWSTEAFTGPAFEHFWVITPYTRHIAFEFIPSSCRSKQKWPLSSCTLTFIIWHLFSLLSHIHLHTLYTALFPPVSNDMQISLNFYIFFNWMAWYINWVPCALQLYGRSFNMDHVSITILIGNSCIQFSVFLIL